MVVSELVLTYLGESECNALLQWCGSYLCTSATSVFVAYEPLGPREDENSSTDMCVLEAYKRVYSRSFFEQLYQGTNTTAGAATRHVPMFSPLGHSCVRVQERFFVSGFGHTHAATAGRAALYAAQKSGSTNKSPVHKLFDERSALTLHLQSNVPVCAFSAGSDILFRRMQCSWTSGALLPRRVLGKDLHLAVETSRKTLSG
jgi:hypothetical protein